jgi:hypothetical protein
LKINIFPHPWLYHGKHELRLQQILHVDYLRMRYPNGLAWQFTTLITKASGMVDEHPRDFDMSVS